jgi:cation-transporting ATPase I
MKLFQPLSHVVPVSRLLASAVSVPVRTAAAVATTASALTVASVETVAGCAATAAAAGVGLTTMPARRAAALMSSAPVGESLARVAGELVGGKPSRRSWRGGNRCWIEVRGLDNTDVGQQLAAAVLDAVRNEPGVAVAQLNHAVSRVVVWVDDDGATLAELCDVVSRAEDKARTAAGDPPRQPATDLPADDVVQARAVATVAVNAAGLATALVARALSWPRLPAGLAAAVTVVDFQPRLRRFVEDYLGPANADTAVAPPPPPPTH